MNKFVILIFVMLLSACKGGGNGDEHAIESSKGDEIIQVLIDPSVITMDLDSETDVEVYGITRDGDRKKVNATLTTKDNDIVTIVGNKLKSSTKIGSASITAKYKNLYATGYVNTGGDTDLMLLKTIPSSVIMDLDKSVTLETIAVYDNGVEKPVEVDYLSSDSSILSADKNVITSHKEGIVQVGGSYTENGKTVSTTISVTIIDGLNNEKRLVGLTADPLFIDMYRDSEAELTNYAVYSDYSKKKVSVDYLSYDNNLIEIVGDKVKSKGFVGGGVIETRYTEDGIDVFNKISVNILHHEPQTLDVTECPSDVPIGVVFHCKVEVTLTDGERYDVSNSVDISSDNENFIVDNFGNTIRSDTVGSSNIKFSYNGLSKTETFFATEKVLDRIQADRTAYSIPISFNDQITIKGIYSNGDSNDVTSLVTYNINNPDIVSVDNNGVITALKPGMAEISATYLGKHLPTNIYVTVEDKAVTSIDLSPKIVTLPLGFSVKLDATAIFSDNTTLDVGDIVDFEDSNLLLDFDGDVATSVKEGKTIVKAKLNNIESNDIEVTVNDAKLISIKISPENVVLPVGIREQFRTAGEFDDGTEVDLSNNVIWSSLTPNTLESLSYGIFRGIAVGTATISATDNSGRTSISAKIDIPVVNKQITRAYPVPSLSFMMEGASQNITMMADWTDETTSEIDPSNIVWHMVSNTPSNANDPIVSNLSSDNLLTAVSQGSAEYYGEIYGSRSEKLQSIVSPPGITDFEVQWVDFDNDGNPDNEFPSGLTSKLYIVGKYSSGEVVDITSVDAVACSVAKGQGRIASVNPNKVIRGLSPGKFDITCSYEGFSDGVSGVVTQAEMTDFDISTNGTNIFIPDVLNITITGRYTDGSTKDVSHLTQFVMSNQKKLKNVPQNANRNIFSTDNTTPNHNQYFANIEGEATFSITVPAYVTGNDPKTKYLTVTSEFRNYWYYGGRTYMFGLPTDQNGNINKGLGYEETFPCDAGFNMMDFTQPGFDGGYKDMVQAILPGISYSLEKNKNWVTSDNQRVIRFNKNGDWPGGNGINHQNGKTENLYRLSHVPSSCHRRGRFYER